MAGWRKKMVTCFKNLLSRVSFFSEGVVTAYIDQTAWNLVQISSINRGSTLTKHIYTKSAICQVKMAEICQKSGRGCENLPLKASLWPHRSSLMHQIWSKWCSDKCQQLLLQTFWHQGPFSWQELGIETKVGQKTPGSHFFEEPLWPHLPTKPPKLGVKW